MYEPPFLPNVRHLDRTTGISTEPGEEITTELRDAAKRILWHAKLLVVCAGLGALLPLVLLSGGERTYVASTRFLVATTTESSAAIADTISAIATSPSQLEWALRRAGLDVDAGTLVDEVSVRTIGESGVVQLSVTDEDPAFAATVANALRIHVSALVHDPQDPVYPTARLLDPAVASAAQEIPPLRSQDLVLGSVLGLVLGVGIACLIEALNPTLVGKEAIAAQLGAPVLGVLPRRAEPESRDMHWIRWRLGAQAARAGVTTVELTAVDPFIDLYPISTALVTNGATPPPDAAPKAAGEAFKLKVGILAASSILPRGSAGLVIVTPRTVKKAAFESTQELLRITGWPAMGAIVYPHGRGASPTFYRGARGIGSAGRKVLTSVSAFAVSGYRAVAAPLSKARTARADAHDRR